jgi:hypothetical protein
MQVKLIINLMTKNQSISPTASWRHRSIDNRD